MKKYILALVLGFISISAFACSCIGPKGFYKSQKNTDLVALVKVVGHLNFEDVEGSSEFDVKTPVSMEVEVIQLIKGVENRNIIVIWGDNGNMCREYISNFKEGGYYLMAIYFGQQGSESFGHPAERETDYYISSCGDYTLDVDYRSKTASGFIKRKRSTRELSKILKRISN